MEREHVCMFESNHRMKAFFVSFLNGWLSPFGLLLKGGWDVVRRGRWWEHGGNPRGRAF